MEAIKFSSVDALFEEEDKADKVHIVVNQTRLKKEYGRLRNYLKDRNKKDYQIITTMQDLGVIVDTKGLSRTEIMKELEDAICTYQRSCRTVKRSS